MTWLIYGNTYDLTTFIHKHPGGKEILEKTKDMGDITPLFESYHAFSNKDYIRQHLENYKKEDASESSYDFKLYNELSNTIKQSYNISMATIRRVSVSSSTLC